MEEVQRSESGAQPSEVSPTPSPPNEQPLTEIEPEPVKSKSKSKSSKKKMILVVIALAALAVLGLWLMNRPTALESAAEKCEQTLSLRDDGKTMILHLWGDEPDNVDITTMVTIGELRCIFDELEMPSAVEDHIYSTRALDGQQTDDWGSFTARWTYHPDEGLNITIREQ